ncbi:hypothetical protein BJ165DRAFT_1518316, partial [Panaeolus papilionaceus]
MFHLSGCPLCAGCRFCNHNQQFTLRSHPSSPCTHCDDPRKSLWKRKVPLGEDSDRQ